MRALPMLTLIAVLGCSSEKPVHTFTPLGATLPDEAISALRFGTDFQLYSLDPALLDPAPDSGRFHNFLVLGVTTPSPSDRERLVDSQVTGVAEGIGAIAACFDPRHGIRVTHDKRRYDFVICFDCLKMNWSIDDSSQPGIETSETPAKVFNAVLSQASVPLPEPPS